MKEKVHASFEYAELFLKEAEKRDYDLSDDEVEVSVEAPKKKGGLW